MRRSYLTDCVAGQGLDPHALRGSLSLHARFSASVVLSGMGIRLDIASLPVRVLMGMAQVFVGRKGDTGDAASVSIDQPNAIKRGSDGRLLVDDVTATNCTTDFSLLYQLSK